MDSNRLPSLTAEQFDRIKGLAAGGWIQAKCIAHKERRSVAAVFAERFPYSPFRSAVEQAEQKAVVGAGTGATGNWADGLLPEVLGSAIIAAGLPFSVWDRFTPLAARVPFNTRIPSEIEAFTASGWVGGLGQSKVVVQGNFTTTSLPALAHASIQIWTDELMRATTPTALAFLRDRQAAGIAAAIDRSFCDPTSTAITDLRPAAITSGAPSVPSSGTTAEAAVADLQSLVSEFVANGGSLETAVFLLSSTNAVILRLSGIPAFEGLTRNGGALGGLPALCSDGVGDVIILVDVSRVVVADEGGIDVNISDEATVEMTDTPSGHSGYGVPSNLVSLWMANSTGVRTTRLVNWQALDNAVAYISDASYIGTGSPAGSP